MKQRQARNALAIIALLLFASTANATSVLHIPSFRNYGGAASVWVDIGTGTQSGTYGIGSFNATLDGQTLTEQLYCLDIFHSFHFGQTWAVTPIVIPPDPPNPPPWNTDEAVWLYNKYGIDASNGTQAGGVQLALWEVSHQENWRNVYTAGTWATQGKFRFNGNTGSGKGAYATTILTDLYDNFDINNAGFATYYEPDPHDNVLYGQGQIGARVVPEPATLMMFGVGLLALAGINRRRYRRG